MASVSLAVLAASTTGCSYFAMERVEGYYRQDQTPRCSASIMPILADAGLAAYGAVGAVMLREEDPGEALAAGGWAVAAIVSGVHGYYARRRCIAAREAHDRWLEERLGLLAPVGASAGAPPASITVEPSSGVTGGPGAQAPAPSEERSAQQPVDAPTAGPTDAPTGGPPVAPTDPGDEVPPDDAARPVPSPVVSPWGDESATPD